MPISPGIFRQNDIRGIVDRDLTVEAAHAIGRAYAGLMRRRGTAGEVAIGRDNRGANTGISPERTSDRILLPPRTAVLLAGGKFLTDSGRGRADGREPALEGL